MPANDVKEKNLPRLAWMLLALFIADMSPLQGQSVVPPGATYLESPADPADADAPAARWPLSRDRVRDLRVAFAPPPADRGDFWAVARDGLRIWSAVPDLPFRFEIVPVTEEADVKFRWIEAFPNSQAGATHRRLDEAGYIEHVTVVLARKHSGGTAMSESFRRFVALHEIGHVLGLPHSENPGDVMHPGNRNMQISPRDVNSLRALYRPDE